MKLARSRPLTVSWDPPINRVALGLIIRVLDVTKPQNKSLKEDEAEVEAEKDLGGLGVCEASEI
jgi:hypothetical protein